MARIDNFRQYAADCMQQAKVQQSPEDRDILLNVALAWVRLAQQSETLPAAPDGEPAADAAAAPAAGGDGKAGVGASP
jgi:hypothetical protein